MFPTTLIFTLVLGVKTSNRPNLGAPADTALSARANCFARYGSVGCRRRNCEPEISGGFRFSVHVSVIAARMKRLISPFSLALALLCFSGIAATVTIIRLHNTQELVSHTYRVEVSLGDLESALGEVGRNRVAYITSGTDDALSNFTAATKRVAPALNRVRQFTSDNPAQQALCDRLDANANQRMAPSFASVQLKQEGRDDPAEQLEINSEVSKAAFETAALSQQMRQNEDRFLEGRAHLSRFLFAATLWILVALFALSALLFWIHFRLLNRELAVRRSAENQLRQLSGRLMRVQDDERKRIARELHDGLGQNMAAAKMTAGIMLDGNPENPHLKELAALLDDSISQTRTISYLLHPPLLDEVGLVSAAKWLIEGYTRRTGVDVSFQIQPQSQPERLPRNFELALFRIIQETLTNIHRHSKSAKAEVSILTTPHKIILLVRDYGNGIPAETLANFESNGVQLGVGLSGMRERVRELGGKLKIKSDGAGTEIIVEMPLVAAQDFGSEI
jgi:signal transduction histidine kinase